MRAVQISAVIDAKPVWTVCNCIPRSLCNGFWFSSVLPASQETLFLYFQFLTGHGTTDPHRIHKFDVPFQEDSRYMNSLKICLCVVVTGLQELRDLLQNHRSWVGGLLGASARSLATQERNNHQTQLLSGLVGALMRCCDPEVRC